MAGFGGRCTLGQRLFHQHRCGGDLWYRRRDRPDRRLIPRRLCGYLAQRELVGLPGLENGRECSRFRLFLFGCDSSIDAIAQRFNAILNASDLDSRGAVSSRKVCLCKGKLASRLLGVFHFLRNELSPINHANRGDRFRPGEHWLNRAVGGQGIRQYDEAVRNISKRHRECLFLTVVRRIWQYQCQAEHPTLPINLSVKPSRLDRTARQSVPVDHSGKIERLTVKC
ncbi:hypothetical protein FLBKAEYF_CDS0026 [Pseudomonas phage PSA-2T]